MAPKDLAAAVPVWTIRDEQGRGSPRARCERDIPTGKLMPLGRIEPRWPRPPRPCKLTVSLALKGTPFATLGRSGSIRRRRAIEPPGLVVSRPGTTPRSPPWPLAAGYCCSRSCEQSHSLPGRFLPVFWSPVWFPTQQPNTMGILCDPKHPALADFPTEFYSNWQWYELLDHRGA